MKILIYPNSTIPEALKIKEQIKALLSGEEITEDKTKEYDFIITVGGDGTILHAAETAYTRGIPIIGVNVGHLGYLTALEKNEIDLLPELIRDKNAVRSHMLLDVFINGEYKKTIVNEAAVMRDGYNGIVHITAEISNEDSFEYRADGLIVSTPTGSTAYSFSAGGPILEHAGENIMLTPVCPHGLMNRSLIISPERGVILRADSRSKLMLLLDGEPLGEITSDTKIEIKKSDKTLDLVKSKTGNFYTVLKSKLL